MRKWPSSRSRRFWTRPRVLAGLRLFWERNGYTVLSSNIWHRTHKGSGTGIRRQYPSDYAIRNHFESYRQAWEAAGIICNRSEEPWSELEEWYLSESIGILTRVEIARDLRRTEGSVKRRMYDLGLDARRRWGWTVHRIEEHLQIPANTLRNLIQWGELPIFRGRFLIYIDPGDLVGVEGVSWRHATGEIKDAARRSLMERAAKILAGIDWRAGRIYQPHPTRVGRYKNRRYLKDKGRPTPAPCRLTRGNIVQVTARPELHRNIRVGRRGLVHLMTWASARKGHPSAWVARVEFKKEKAHGSQAKRVNYTIPVSCLRKVAWRKGDPVLQSPSARRGVYMRHAQARKRGERLKRLTTLDRLEKERHRRERQLARRARSAAIKEAGGIFRGRQAR